MTEEAKLKNIQIWVTPEVHYILKKMAKADNRALKWFMQKEAVKIATGKNT